MVRGAGLALGALLWRAAFPADALAHPHVFAEAKVEIVGNSDAEFVSIRNIWRMDELFSSSVLVDFDANADSVLDDAELDAVGETVRESIADWGFYTFVETGAGAERRDVKLAPPEKIHTLWENGQLIFFFEMPAAEAVDLSARTIAVSNFDESFFVAFDFGGTDAFQLIDMPEGCTKQLHVPDENEAASEWMASIADIGADETIEGGQASAFADMLATRMEVGCGAAN